MKIVAIANQKGGVGKTTTAVNLGAALAELGHRILLIDLDPQANATSSFGLQEAEGISLYEPLLGGASVTEKIFPTRRDNLFIVPSDIDLAGAEVEIARMPDHLTRLAEALKPLQADDTFDFVFIDCPPSLGILMSNALAAAGELLTPIQCEYFALEGLVKIVRLVEQVRDSGANARLELGGIVMTMFDGNRSWSTLPMELPPTLIAPSRASSSSAILRPRKHSGLPTNRKNKRGESAENRPSHGTSAELSVVFREPTFR